MELTQEQIERQDFVDNSIFELLQNLNPTNKDLEWDIEVIGGIRNLVGNYFLDKKVCSEQEFYP